MQTHKKLKARILSLALTVTMVLAMMPTAALAADVLAAPEWTVTGWQDTYTVGDTVKLTLSYPGADKYYLSGSLPAGLSITNTKDGIYYTPENGALHISGTTTEAFSNRYVAVTAYSEGANLGDKRLPFEIVVASSTTISKAITIGTAAPVNDASVADGTNQAPTGANGPTVTWSADNGGTWAVASGNFAANTAYQTKYVYTAQSGYVFDSTITNTDITVANLGSGSVTAALSDSNKTLTVIVTWPATEADAPTTGDFTVVGGTYGTDYSYADNTLTILTDTPITISGATTTDMLAVDTSAGTTAQVTLNGMDITTSNAAPIRFTSLATLHLTLEGTNALTARGGSDYAIQIQSSGNELTIDGDGSLAITSRNRIAVGTSGSITLNGGTTTIKTTGTQSPFAVISHTLTLGPNMEAKCNTGSNTDYHEEAYINNGKLVTELNGSTGAADVKITAAAPASSKRTTTLDLTDGSSWQSGCTQNGTLWTNASEGWSYDTSNNTLALNGVNFDIAASGSETSGISLPADAAIVAEGENNVSVGDLSGAGEVALYGLKSAGTLTVKGTGTLNVTTGNATAGADSAYNMACSSAALIAEGSVKLNLVAGNAQTSGNEADDYAVSKGLNASNGITIKDTAEVRAKAGIVAASQSYLLQSYGAFTFTNAEIKVEGGSIWATGGGQAFIYMKAVPNQDQLTVTGSADYNASTLSQAYFTGNTIVTETQSYTTAKTAQITFGTEAPSEIILGTTPGYANTEADLRKAMADIPENGVIKLSGNITLTDSIELTSGKFILDLQSHSITGNSTKNYPAIYVDGAELTIRATTGKITGPACQSAAGIKTGKLTIEGGTFTGGSRDGAAFPGNAISKWGGTLVLKGGTYVAGGAGAYSYVGSLTDLIAVGYKAQWVNSGADLTSSELSASVRTESFKIVSVVVTIADVIADANTAKNGISIKEGPASNVASGTKFVTAAEMKALTDAIAAAQAVADNADATDAEISAAITALNNAVETFKTAIKTGTKSSGGSSGGSSYSQGTKPTEPVSGTTNTTATVDSKGNATTTVTTDNISKAIQAAKDEASKKGVNAGKVTVIINVATGGKNADTVTVNLPKTTQQQVIGNKLDNLTLVIEKPDISISLNLAAITEINKQANADVQLSAARMDNSKLSGEAKAAIGSRPVFDLNATYGDGSKAVTSFSKGSVNVAIPYTLQAGEMADGLYAVYIDGNGKVNDISGSSYDANAKVVRFATNHFSVYGVGYKAPIDLTDIAGHWAKTDIEFVVNRGLMSGTSSTTFSPDGSMTRGMFVTALGRLAEVDENSHKTSKFTDVKADAYYAPYVNWAADKGITSGTTAATFSPDATVTRQEMAEFMSNFAKAMGYKLPATHEAVTFADNGSIAGWAAAAVKQMQMAGVINGKNDNKFDPTGTATRAEVAAILHRYVELVIDPATAQ